MKYTAIAILLVSFAAGCGSPGQPSPEEVQQGREAAKQTAPGSTDAPNIPAKDQQRVMEELKKNPSFRPPGQ